MLQASQPTTTAVHLPMLPRPLKAIQGGVHEDVDDWMQHFEHVARFNNWSDNRSMDNMYNLRRTHGTVVV